MSFEHKIVRKNLILSACFCSDSRLSLREMDQKLVIGGTFGYGDSYLEFLSRLFKVFRVDAILYDAKEKWGHILSKVLATVTRWDEEQSHVCLVT